MELDGDDRTNPQQLATSFAVAVVLRASNTASLIVFGLEYGSRICGRLFPDLERSGRVTLPDNISKEFVEVLTAAIVEFALSPSEDTLQKVVGLWARATRT